MGPLKGKESFPQKENLPKKIEPQSKPKDESLFGGKKVIYGGGWSGVEKSLRRDPGSIKEMEKILRVGDPWKKIKPSDLDEEVKKLEKRVDLNKSKSFTPLESQWAMKKEFWSESLEKRKKDPFKYKDRYEIEKRKEEDNFLKKKFGVK